jgi:hypothetical protein
MTEILLWVRALAIGLSNTCEYRRVAMKQWYVVCEPSLVVSHTLQLARAECAGP